MELIIYNSLFNFYLFLMGKITKKAYPILNILQLVFADEYELKI